MTATMVTMAIVRISRWRWRTAVELSVEWLWEIREKLLAHEYLVLLATFVAIQIMGLNQGLIIGVGFSTLFFVISYASERRCGCCQHNSAVGIVSVVNLPALVG